MTHMNRNKPEALAVGRSEAPDNRGISICALTHCIEWTIHGFAFWWAKLSVILLLADTRAN
jgi:hypothetical protein